MCKYVYMKLTRNLDISWDALFFVCFFFLSSVSLKDINQLSLENEHKPRNII